MMAVQSNQPPLKALRVLATVVRFDRYADAAIELGVTPSAISQQIRILEDWVGAPLFDRATKTPTLTAIGQALVDGIADPLARIDGACRAVKRQTDQNTVVVSSSGAYASYLLIPALHTFWEQHPAIHVDVRLATRFDAPFEREGVDLAIRFLHDHKTARPLGRRGWRAVCHRSHFEDLGRPESLAEFQSGTFLHEVFYNFWPEAFDIEGLDIPPSIDFRGVGDASHVMAGVLAGKAMALLPASLVQPAIRDGTLVSPFTTKLESQAAYFALVDERSTKPSTQTLVDFLHAAH